MNIKLFFILFIIWFFFIREKVVMHGAGIVAPLEPVQQKTDVPLPFSFKEYTITPLRSFTVEARVLSKERYRFDDSAKLSPVDLALGWGKMSDEKVLDKIEISQSGRWYYWKTDKFPIPRREIETHSANMHMIPANKEVEEKLLSIRRGEVVKIEGYLVQVDGKESFRWISSLSRNDTGAHACEVVFVKNIEKIDK